MIYVGYYQLKTGATQMAKRTRKSPALSAKQNTTAVISYIRELPGAVFLGDIAAADVDQALGMQKIRTCFENDGDEELLWLDCQEMGFESREIRRFAANPALITSCGYYGAGALSQRC
jgi:hypothetical protein